MTSGALLQRYVAFVHMPNVYNDNCGSFTKKDAGGKKAMRVVDDKHSTNKGLTDT